MHLEVICEADRWRHLSREWHALSEQCESTTPFQLPEWLLTWWAHFGSGELQVLAYREQGELVGLLPFFLHSWEGRRQVTLIGSGISDYLEPIMVPEYKSAIIQSLQGYLQQRSDWDVCVWQDLNLDSPLATLGELQPETPSSAIVFKDGSFRQTFDEYWAARGPNLRRNVKRYGKRADSAAPVEFAVGNLAEPALIDALVRLHGARWAAHGHLGMVAANGSDPFLRELARAFAKRNMLRIFTLRFSNEIAAIIMAFEFRRRVYGYLTGFDPDLQEFGLGKLLLYDALRHCFAEGCTAWDFLRGEEPYKADWGAESIPKSRVLVVRKSLLL